ncbi:major facilitator superfamily transporter [Apiospora arundinis]|uniref:Major facilitator superfamily transporter n=1 Tax=Apiospora arundinis TaxID=335852 RepID=A0ABR2IUD8_9PEZI
MSVPASTDSEPATKESSPQETDATVGEIEWKAGKQEIIILVTLASISLVVALEATILVPALPTLARALGGTSVETFWAGTSYLLANAVFVPFIGALSDIFGRRELLMASILLFTLGAIICCVAQSFEQLLPGRTIQGIGGGGISTMSLVILTDIVPLRQRPKYQMFSLLAWALGAVVGPLAGGLIAQHTTWRWIFYLNFPICGVGLVVVPLTVRIKPPTQLSLVKNLSRVDWIGGALFTASVSSFLIGLTWGGVQFSWASYQSWMPILLGGIGIVASLVYEKRVAALPFLRLSVFSGPSSYIAFFGATVQGLVLYGHLYYEPFYLASVKGLTATMTGVVIMGVNLLLFPVTVVAGITMSRRGTFLWAVRCGWAILTLGNGLLLMVGNTSVVGNVFIFLVASLGEGLLIPSLNLATQAIARSEDVAFAVSLYTFMRTFGMCLGVAISGVIFQNVMLRQLRVLGLPDEIAADAESFVASLNEMAPGEEKSAYISAYLQSFYGIFYAYLALSAVCFLASFGIKHHDVNKKLDSEHRLGKNKKEEVQPPPS